MAKDREKVKQSSGSIEVTLIPLEKTDDERQRNWCPQGRTRMRPRRRSSGVAFYIIITVANGDVDKAVILQNFALQERAVDSV